MRIGSLCAATLLVLSGAASAGSITINDLTDTITITDNTGGRFSPIPCVGEICGFNIAGPAGTASLTPNFVGANLHEPGAPNASDTLEGQFLTTSTSWLFTSDGESGLPFFIGGGSNVNDLVEDGTAQNAIVIRYFNVDSQPNGTDTIFIQSDVESGVPEPSTWLMALGGLALLCGIRTRIVKPYAEPNQGAKMEILVWSEETKT